MRLGKLLEESMRHQQASQAAPGTIDWLLYNYGEPGQNAGGFNLLPPDVQQSILANPNVFLAGNRGWNQENNSIFSIGAEGGYNESAYRNAQWDPQRGLILNPASYIQVQDEGSLGGGFVGDLANAGLATAGFGVGGVSGASAATGGGVTPETLAIDAAGLGAGYGLSGLLAAAPAAGGTVAAPAAGGAALGTGLTPGAAGVTGLTQGAAGASGLAAAPAAGTALAPGFFAAESLYPVAGGITAAGTTGGAGTAGSTGTGAGGAGAGITLSQIAAGAIPAAFGAFGANQQANQYGALANQYMAMGAPYRSRLSDLYSDPEDWLNSPEVQIPVQQGTNILARSLSTKGNPTGSGNALQELQNYASKQLFDRLGSEKDRLAGFGGLSAYNSAAPSAANAQIGAQKGIYDAIGAGAADIFNPPRRYNLRDLLREGY